MHVVFPCSFWVALASALAGAGAQETDVKDYVQGKVFDRFITIWLENEDLTPALSSPALTTLAASGITLTNFHALTHPSQPNYLASIGGDYFGLDNDGVVTVPDNVSTLVDLLAYRNISWGGYFEDLPTAEEGGLGVGSTPGEGGKGSAYVRKHNPFISYASIPNAALTTHLFNFPTFLSAATRNTLPQYSHLSPNQTNNGHDTTLTYTASWLARFLSPLLALPTFTNRTLIQIVFDEAATAGANKVFCLLLGDAIPPALRGTMDSGFYTHYSVLATLQANFALPNLGRYDVGANIFPPLAEALNHTPTPTPVYPGTNKAVLLNKSYPGPLNSAKKGQGWPRPNLGLVGAGGVGVLPRVREVWAGEVAGEGTPYEGSGMVWDGNVPPVYSQVNGTAAGAGQGGKSGGVGRGGGVVAATAAVVMVGVLAGFIGL